MLLSDIPDGYDELPLPHRHMQQQQAEQLSYYESSQQHLPGVGDDLDRLSRECDEALQAKGMLAALIESARTDGVSDEEGAEEIKVR